MAYDYGNLRDSVVTPILRQYGTNIKLLRTEDTLVFEKRYDPTTLSYYWFIPSTGERFDTQPESTRREYVGQGVLSNYKDEEVDGTNIKREDMKLIMTGVPTPKQGDLFEVGGKIYKYEFHKNVAPAVEPVVYLIQVRI